VADEQWHPQQEGTWLADGSYELRIPYRESGELVMDVLRHGTEVSVTAPAALRRDVSLQLERAAAQYASNVASSRR
jgi:proteasome accessory factor C